MSISTVAASYPPYPSPVPQNGPSSGYRSGNALTDPKVLGILGATACIALAGAGLLLCASASSTEKDALRQRENLAHYLDSRRTPPATYNADVVNGSQPDISSSPAPSCASTPSRGSGASRQASDAGSLAGRPASER